ncbi:hypothetical protein GUJ93_ZPchr0001g33057 [Zizania palustris]|uniref:Uncharacterized protein n=1 Tax=Zizania palustris TaxID=103762 RepID=A0A8J5RUX7_ZIZPA|nr:hypothetical protein GUJ93_ZPchr0001g33057 [Zizania palustris]
MWSSDSKSLRSEQELAFGRTTADTMTIPPPLPPPPLALPRLNLHFSTTATAARPHQCDQRRRCGWCSSRKRWWT